MYDWLLRFLPPRWAALVLVLWYTALFCAVVILSGIATASFRYGRL